MDLKDVIQTVVDRLAVCCEEQYDEIGGYERAIDDCEMEIIKQACKGLIDIYSRLGITITFDEAERILVTAQTFADLEPCSDADIWEKLKALEKSDFIQLLDEARKLLSRLSELGE